MTKIKYSQIHGPQFATAFNTFADQARATDGATTMRLVRITGVIEKAAEHAETARMKIIEAHAERDDDDTPRIENNNYIISDEGKRLLNELFAEEFECECVDASKIANLHELAPATLAQLVRAGVLVDDTGTEG